jgi:hypothetical protein
VWNETDETSNYLPLDDSEYPYADLPRFVIETDDFREIRDTETEIPARMQIYDKSGPSGDILELTVRGRGTSSFIAMPKLSIKMEFDKKQALLGLPENRDWALISNFADRTLLKNFAVYRLSDWLQADYSPKGKFVELYFNRSYMGVYLLSETIKTGSNRVDIEKYPVSFLLEKTSKEKAGKNYVTTNSNYLFRIRHPKEITDSLSNVLKNHLDSVETYFSTSGNKDKAGELISMEDFFRFYWIQEFAKNSDGAFHRSVFMTWIPGQPIKFGPIWDFDMGFGNNFYSETAESYSGWVIKNSGWFAKIFADKKIWKEATLYWKANKESFNAFADSLDIYAQTIQKATVNEFKRWDVLENTEFWAYKEGYQNYQEGVDTFKSWVKQRIQWIDKQLN